MKLLKANKNLRSLHYSRDDRFISIKCIVVSIAFLILLSACSFVKSGQGFNEEALKKHLQIWKSFRIDGLLEVEYKAFEFRKDAIIRKDENIVRLDVLDTGILGMHPSPFLTAYLDSLLSYKMGKEKVVVVEKEEMAEELGFDLNFLTKIDELESKINTLKENRIIIDEYLFEIDKDSRIKSIKNNQMSMEVTLSYRNDYPELIEVKIDNKNVGNIKIDKFSHEKIKVKKPKILRT